MRLRCKSCGAQIEARDVNMAALKAQCAACGGKFHFGQEDVPPIGHGVAGEAEAFPPKHITATLVEDRLVIQRRWSEGPLDWMAYLIIAWYVILGIATRQVWAQNLPWQPTFQITVLIIVLACLGVTGIYAFFQGLWNSTWIRVSPRTLRVSHGPLRVSRRRAMEWDFEAPSPKIRQIYARMAINPDAAPSIHGGYDIHVILHNGVHEVALHGIQQEQEALYLCQQIRKHLQLPRTRMEQRTAPEQVPRPEKIEIDISAHQLALIYRFGTVLSLAPAILCIAIGLVVVLVMLATAVLERQPLHWYSWPLGPMIAAEILLILCVVRLAVRRKILEVEAGKLTVDDFPARLTQPFVFPLQGVEQFFCKARPRRLRPPWRTGNTLEFTYEVWAIDSQERRTRIIAALGSADEAFFIEQEIERHLGMEDAVVRGEITRPGSAKALDLQRQLNLRHDLLAALRLEATHATGQQFPASLRALLQYHQNSGDDLLLEDAARILQLPPGEMERLMWEMEEAADAAASAEFPAGLSSAQPDKEKESPAQFISPPRYL